MQCEKGISDTDEGGGRGPPARSGRRARSGLCLLALLLAVLLTPACAGFPSIPPLFEREGDLPGDVFEERALFGIASARTARDGSRELALRPLLVQREPADGGRFTQVLTPFAVHTETLSRKNLQIWPFLFDTSFGSDHERDVGESDDDVMIFPVAAWGDEPGQGSYLLVLPVGGTLKSKLLSEEITTWAFPAYVRVRDGDWRSTHVLWPLIASGEGGGRSHFRVLPFWSQTDSEKAHHRAVAWPFVQWSSQERNGRTVDGWFAFPFVGHAASQDATFSQWTALYPFFQWSSDSRTGDEHESLLWPFYKRDVRPGRSAAVWYWPFWGEYASDDENSSFYAWPLVWDQSVVSASGRRRELLYVVPLWMRSETIEPDGETRSVALRSWPAFSWSASRDGLEDLRIPNISPVFGWDAGETAYGDLVTLFRWRSDRRGRVAWDGPLGLVRYRRGYFGDRKLTLFWWIDIPLGKDPEAAPESDG